MHHQLVMMYVCYVPYSHIHHHLVAIHVYHVQPFLLLVHPFVLQISHQPIVNVQPAHILMMVIPHYQVHVHYVLSAHISHMLV
jgi:hypothetical protein